jgi:O-acetylserine/cysteine efflux transporter
MGRRVPTVALAVAAVCWGTANTGTKYALRGFGPVSLLAVELTCATCALWAVVLVRGYHSPRSTGVNWRRIALLGALEPALAYLSETLGLARTSAANGALIQGLECAFVVVLAAIFLRERITWPIAAATMVAGIGFVALETEGGLAGPGLGDLLVLAGALCAATYTIVARGIGEESDPLSLTAVQFSVATALTLPLAGGSWLTGAESAPTSVDLRYWVVAGLVGIGGYALSFLLYNDAIAVVEAAPAAVIINLIPVVGLGTAVLLLRERLSDHGVLGATLIGGSVLVFAVFEARSEVAPPAVPAGRAPPLAVPTPASWPTVSPLPLGARPVVEEFAPVVLFSLDLRVDEPVVIDVRVGDPVQQRC